MSQTCRLVQMCSFSSFSNSLCGAEMFACIFHSFKSEIADAKSSNFKWRKICLFIKNCHRENSIFLYVLQTMLGCLKPYNTTFHQQKINICFHYLIIAYYSISLHCLIKVTSTTIAITHVCINRLTWNRPLTNNHPFHYLNSLVVVANYFTYFSGMSFVLKLVC